MYDPEDSTAIDPKDIGNVADTEDIVDVESTEESEPTNGDAQDDQPS